MKKLLLSAAAVAALTVSASAADLGVSYVDPGPVVVEDVFDWTGFYLGVHGGYGGDKFDYDLDITDGGDSVFDAGADITSSGFFAGGQIGGNWQMNQFVLGAVADIAWSEIKGELGLSFDPDGDGGADEVDIELGSEVNWFGTARLRAGWLPTERLLTYVTGGFAYGDVEHSASFGDEEISTSDTQMGWTVGAGVEYAVTQNITLFTEYLYVDLGSQDLIDEEGDDAAFSLEADTKFHTVKAGLNFLW